ncbi:MAG: hypothetical protein LUI60_03400 [Clostridia bacterium]|nr:hypothetical protein [Clostridia bacterium]
MAVLLASIAALSVAAFTACDNGEVGTGDNYQILLNTEDAFVFTATQDVLTLSDTTSVKDYLDALVTLGQMTYEGKESDYGLYITSVNGKSEEYAETYMTYWSLYTNLYSLDGVTYATSDYDSYTYESETFGYSNYGFSNLPCVEGYKYALVYSTYYYTSY